uniref:Uncharacterized protein n=1 Tax=Clytia hemisphaerica TaxID=252671 RepID=A0A7M5X0Y7_9CNID
MSTSLPSLMSRRRKISGYSGLDHAKVIADYVPSSKSPHSSYQDNYALSREEKQNARDAAPAGKERCNDPSHVSFIYENSRFINQPVCFANTNSTRRIQNHWWPDKPPVETKRVLPYNTETIQRTDYNAQNAKPIQSRATRFGKTHYSKAESILPNQDGNENRKLKPTTERISYEHNFDSRKERTERGKLHGAFVWEPLRDNIQRRENVQRRLLKF